MIFNDFTISLAQWAMNVERQRASIAADNIASASTGGIKKTGNFEELISNVSKAVESRNPAQINDSMFQSVQIKKTNSSSLTNSISLDEEIADLNKAGGRYRVVAEALSRKFGLMTIVSRRG